MADGLGNVYITGDSNGPCSNLDCTCGYDAFVAKYDADGNQVWLQEFGTPLRDTSNGVALDAMGNVFVVGTTNGSFGAPNLGGADVYLAKFDSDGNEIWIHQFGTDAADASGPIRVDEFGDVYLAGRTRGNLGGPIGGSVDDVFLAKFNVSDVSVPEPSAAFILLPALMGFLSLRQRFGMQGSKSLSRMGSGTN